MTLTEKKEKAVINKVFDVSKSPIKFWCSEKPRRNTKVIVISTPKNIIIFVKTLGLVINLVLSWPWKVIILKGKNNKNHSFGKEEEEEGIQKISITCTR